MNARQAIESHAKLLDLIEELRQHESKLNPELPRRDEKAWRRFFEWVEEISESATTSTTVTSKPESAKTPPSVTISERISISKAVEASIRGETDDKNKTILANEDGDNQQQQQLTKSNVVNNLDDNDNDNNDDLGDHDEYSLITRVACQKGEIIFNVDRSLMLTTETALADSDLFAFIKNDSIASGMQNVVLVLHLLNEYSKRKKSHWWPYLSILPSKLLPTLRLNRRKLQQNLAASSHVFEALKMLRAIARQYAYFYKRLQATNLPLKKDFTFLYYAWGVSIVCSRQNEIPQTMTTTKKNHQHATSNNRGDQHQTQPDNAQLTSMLPVVHALIPVLDMCNHNRHSNQATFENNSSLLMASSNLKPGQEITINYGCGRSSGDFYIHNGFVPDEVPFDVVPLTIALSKNTDKLFELKAKLLKILNMPTLGRFKLTMNNYENRHKRDPHLTMFLICQFLQEAELELILTDGNPVGLADAIYDYVQYKANDDEKSELNGHHQQQANDLEAKIGLIKRRVALAIKDYLSKRSSICVALIDRSLSELKENENEQQQQDDKLYAIKLLQHERKIYSSYIVSK